MGFKNTLRNIVVDFIASVRLVKSRKNEIKKFQDPRRVKIFSQCNLSEEQKRQIDEVYLKNYGEKVPYIWHRYYTTYTGNFDEKYFPELIFIPEFEQFENLWPAYCKVFSDKNVLPIIAEKAGITVPKTIFSCTKGLLRDSDYHIIDRKNAIEILSSQEEVFVKPSVDTCSGQGCFVWENKESKLDLEKLGSDFIIQERVKCHDSIAKIYSGSVNTFRIITYRWKNKIEHLPAVMRIGQGGNYLDNAHAGGVFIAIDDNGTLHEIAFTEFQDRYDSHPDTGLQFKGYKIPLFPKVLKAALRMHEMIPQVGCVNWDFTIDEFGDPVLIEANINGGGIWIIEMAHGCGAFGDKTQEILQWMHKMKHTKAFERNKYAFGQME